MALGRYSVAVISLLLSVVLLFCLAHLGRAGGALGVFSGHVDSDLLELSPPPCTKTYEYGTSLLDEPTSKRILASPEELKPYIRSVSNRRYWGLADNLLLKKSDDPQRPVFLEIKIPRGSINPGNKTAPRGGAGYHWTPAELPERTVSACLSYSLWFPPDYDFVKGGKLPGIFGGTGPSGGKKVTGKNGFSTRFMWRRDGRGEVYAYIIGNDRRGISLDRGAWRFEPGVWTSLAQEVILNSPDKSDGKVRVWVNDRLVLARSGLRFRSSDSINITGVMAHVFFGGKDPSWASTRDSFVRMTPFDLRWNKLPQDKGNDNGSVE